MFMVMDKKNDHKFYAQTCCLSNPMKTLLRFKINPVTDDSKMHNNKTILFFIETYLAAVRDNL